MPEFVAPTTRVHASFLKAMAEFQAEGRGYADDHTMVGTEIRTNSASWHRPAAFAEYTNALRAQSLDDAPRPIGHVPCTTLWWVEGDEYLGRLAIRHRLTEWLRNVGGHVGYDVRPTCPQAGSRHRDAARGAAASTRAGHRRRARHLRRRQRRVPQSHRGERRAIRR
jgi:predicted acetyltransferase